MTNRFKKAKVSDLKIGLVCWFDFGGNLSKNIIRGRLTIPELRKNKIGYPKEESIEDYTEYKRIIKKFVNDGNILIEKDEK